MKTSPSFVSLSFAIAVATTALAASDTVPVRSVTDPGVVVTRQAITPAGVQSVFDGRVYGVAFGANPAEIWALDAKRLYRLDWRANRVVSSNTVGGKPGLQAIAV